MKDIQQKTSSQQMLDSKLDKIEDLLNSVLITLDDLRDEVVALRRKQQDDHENLWSDVGDIQVSLKNDIKNLDDRVDEIENESSDAFSRADDALCENVRLEEQIEEFSSRMTELESTMAEVLLLNN